MAKASDNLYPYVHVVPAAAPASPAAGSERLFLDSADGNKLKRKNSSGSVTTIESSGGTPGRVLLKETILAAAVATVSFTSTDIPTSGYRHLQLQVVARSSVAATQDNVFMALNADTTAANYLRSRLTGVNTTVSGISQADRGLGAISAASASANSAGLIDVTFLNYRDTTFDKVAHGFNYNRGATTIQQLAWEWFNTAAITSLDLTCGGNFAIGSKFQLYGLV